MKEYNYASEGAEDVVALIVRKNEKYGEAVPGDRVIVDRSELKHLTRRGMGGEAVGPLMTLEEQKKLEADRAARRKKQPITSGLKKMVEEGLARLASEAGAITKKRKAEVAAKAEK